MPISFLQESIGSQSAARSQVIGVLCKGAEGKNGIGKELPYFRLRPKWDGKEGVEMVQHFQEQYGDEPTSLEILLPYDNPTANFSSWMMKFMSDRKSREAGHGGTLLHKCDGTNIRQWWNGKRYCGALKPCAFNREEDEKCPEGCQPRGSLFVYLPSMMTAYGDKYLGMFEIQTSSWNDLVHIPTVLESVKSQMSNTYGVLFRIRRQAEAIPVPQFAGKQRTENRTRQVHYMLKLEIADKQVLMAKLNSARAEQSKMLGSASYTQPQLSGHPTPGLSLNESQPALPGRGHTPQPRYTPGSIEPVTVEKAPKSAWQLFLGMVGKANGDAQKLAIATGWAKGDKQMPAISKELGATPEWAGQVIDLVGKGFSVDEALSQVNKLMNAPTDDEPIDADYVDAESGDNF